MIESELTPSDGGGNRDVGATQDRGDEIMSGPIPLGLFYGAIYLWGGAASPYIPVWFHHRGMSGAEIGLILSAPMLARLITAPAVAMWADGFGLRRTSLILSGLIMAAASALLSPQFGAVWWFAVWFVASTAYSSIAPLTDVLVLARSRSDGFNYGWPRGIGSAAFIVGNLAMGALVVWRSPELLLVWLTVTGILVVLGARFLVPPDSVRASGDITPLKQRLAGLRGLFRDRDFMLMAVSAGLIQSAHAFYYAFSTLVWKQQGIAENLTGLLWGTGVAAEIGFLWFLEPWRKRVGARNLLVMGGVAAVVRWTMLAFSPPLWALFPIQALHTFSYAATFIGALEMTDQLSDRETASGAQLINSALSGGVLSGLATLVSGPLFDRWGAAGYLAMTAMSALGLVGALRLYGVRRLDS